jgi:ribonuclease HII
MIGRKLGLLDLEEFENSLRRKGLDLICGVDEAGRGCLAGPVVAAAVILDCDKKIEGLGDSKTLSAKRREKLAIEIKNDALDFCICEASAKEIDKFDILRATLLAMKRAVDGLSLKPNIVLVDGNIAPKIDIKSKTIIKGDSICSSIAAASILAKVYRDSLMVRFHFEYPNYNLYKHKGYGTKLHLEMIKKYGVCDIHRKTFKMPLCF